jgi:hypothetical protein
MMHLEVAIMFFQLTIVWPGDNLTGNGATNVRVWPLQGDPCQGYVRQEVSMIIPAAATIPYLWMAILRVTRISGAGVPNASC